MTTQAPPELLQSPYRKNLFINGDMRVNQRGFAGPTAYTNQSFAYAADRFIFYANHSTGAATLTRDTDVPTYAQAGANFSASVDVDITTILASPGATNESTILQRIEGYDIAGIIGSNITWSVWVKSNKTGIYSASFRNESGNRTYVTEFTIDTSATWEKKIITIPLDDVGTWNKTNGYGLQVSIGLMTGSSYSTSTLDEWHTTSGEGYSTNQVNLFDSTSNYFKTTGWQLEVGDIATDFEHRLYADEFDMCQRYYQQSISGSTFTGTTGMVVFDNLSSIGNTALFRETFPLNKEMADAPAMTTYSVTNGTSGSIYNNSLASDVAVNAANISKNNFTLTNQSGSAVAASTQLRFHWTAYAEL